MRVCACVHACHKSVSGPLSRPPMATCCRPSTLNGRGAPEAAEARPRAHRPVDECSCRATRRVMCCMRALSSGVASSAVRPNFAKLRGAIPDTVNARFP